MLSVGDNMDKVADIDADADHLTADVMYPLDIQSLGKDDTKETKYDLRSPA